MYVHGCCSEQSLGIDRRANVCCILFGIVIVYVTSIIIHLGPTIIGGDFNYNDMIGNCIFVYGTVKSYVVHAMWIAIMTLVLASASYYLGVFHRHIQAGSTHRLASVLRAVIAARSAVSCRNPPDTDTTSPAAGAVDYAKTRRSWKRLDWAVRNSLSRSRVLILITSLFIACWYPLYVLTLVDPKFEQPSKLYKVLTFIAWSNATLNPLVFLLFDANIGTLKRIGCMTRDATAVMTSSRRHPVGRRESGTRRSSGSVGTGSVYERVGSRLHSEGQYQLADRDVSEDQQNGTGLRQLVSTDDIQMDAIAL